MVTVDSAMRASCETSLGRRQQGSEVVIHVLDARRGAASAHRCPPPMFDLATTYVSRRRGRLRAASVPVEPHQLAIPANPLIVSPRTPAGGTVGHRLALMRGEQTVEEALRDRTGEVRRRHRAIPPGGGGFHQRKS